MLNGVAEYLLGLILLYVVLIYYALQAQDEYAHYELGQMYHQERLLNALTKNEYCHRQAQYIFVMLAPQVLQGHVHEIYLC